MDLLRNQIDTAQNEMTALLEKLVRIDSGSHNVEGVMKVASVVKEELDKLEFHTELVECNDAGPILMGENKGVNEKNVILLGHMDTVFDETAQVKNPYRRENGRILGPGVLDMKSGIVQIIYALKLLKVLDKLEYGIKIILVGDEEVGHINSSALQIFEKEAKDSYCVFCCEFGRPDNQIVLERKGVGTMTLDVQGRAAHAGNELASGRNAVVELSRLIMEIDNLYTDPEADLTASIGIIEGGTAVNVVPDRAKGIFDVRFTHESSLDKLIQNVEEMTKNPHKDYLTTDLGYIKEYPPMMKTNSSEQFLHFVSERSEKLGFGRLKPVSVGGGADSSFFSALNVPTLCSFGPVGQNAHTLDEFIIEESLYVRTLLLADCLAHIKELDFE